MDVSQVNSVSRLQVSKLLGREARPQGPCLVVVVQRPVQKAVSLNVFVSHVLNRERNKVLNLSSSGRIIKGSKHSGVRKGRDAQMASEKLRKVRGRVRIFVVVEKVEHLQSCGRSGRVELALNNCFLNKVEGSERGGNVSRRSNTAKRRCQVASSGICQSGCQSGSCRSGCRSGQAEVGKVDCLGVEVKAG